MNILDIDASEPLHNYINKPSKPLWIELIWLIVFVFLGLFLANFLGLIAVLPFFDYKIDLFQEAVSNPFHKNIKIPLLIIQGITQFTAFLVAPYLFIRMIENKTIDTVKIQFPKASYMLLIVALIMIIVMPANSWMVEINKNMVLPDWLHWFESWAQAKEKSLEELTMALTDLRTPAEIVLGILIFGVLPAAGEELLFRGVIQRKLIENNINPHVSIIITGVIFSAIHLQFYGFLPRMLLGILLGYIYWWTGNLLFSIMGHFVNNAFTLIMIILKNLEYITLDIENTTHVPIEVFLGSLLSFIALTTLFWLNRKTVF